MIIHRYYATWPNGWWWFEACRVWGPACSYEAVSKIQQQPFFGGVLR